MKTKTFSRVFPILYVSFSSTCSFVMTQWVCEVLNPPALIKNKTQQTKKQILVVA